ncbi:hypothetical protein E2C01_090008 [Portunus trituberculatus]|uniref:Uncharacterized protein n=1 Tax=Portunus trituberculatus TaxID=210409 RepID=A0A5B7JF30_PORTR|nr:hypothetical protein [Portunus trituberculatus]
MLRHTHTHTTNTNTNTSNNNNTSHRYTTPPTYSEHSLHHNSLSPLQLYLSLTTRHLPLHPASRPVSVSCSFPEIKFLVYPKALNVPSIQGSKASGVRQLSTDAGRATRDSKVVMVGKDREMDCIRW